MERMEWEKDESYRQKEMDERWQLERRDVVEK
jgi:hypothetical protein